MSNINKNLLADRCLDSTDLALRQAVDALFDHLDDELFALAEQSGNNSTQQMYFDAMRQIRSQRLTLSGLFLDSAIGRLRLFLRGKPYLLTDAETGKIQPEDKTQALALMANADLEEDLTVSRVASHCESVCASQLELLNGLLASLTNRQMLTNSENPVGPDLLANCFRLALVVWAGDQQVRLVLFDLFSKYVLAAMPGHYQDMIRLLQEAGVQPTAKPAATRKTAAPVSEKPAPEPLLSRKDRPSIAQPSINSGQGSEGSNLFTLVSLLRGLMDSMRGEIGLPFLGAEPESSLPALRPQEVLDTLSQLQSGLSELSPLDLRAAQDSNESLKHELVDKLRQAASAKGKQVHRVDRHILDMLLLMFDFVLEDPLMPAPMKVLLSRLQLPFMRTALLDRSFMIDRDHPARKLLNQLSRSAIRWSDSSDLSADGPFGAIEKAVNQVLSSPHSGERALYEAVGLQFSAWLEVYERGAKVAEDRSSQVAKGQEKLVVARRRVDQTLKSLLSGRIPVAVYRVLDGPWRDVLTLSILRHGEDSEAWRAALSIATRLIQSVAPQASEAERQRKMRDIPALLGDLREGFASVSYDTAKTATLFKELQLCHIMALRGMQPELHLARQFEQNELMQDSQINKDEFDRLAASILPGQWLAWQLDGRELRAKLSWRSEIADVMLFVDNRGRKVVEMTSQDLADLFRNHRAMSIGEVSVPLLDRALQAVLETLRRLSGSGAATLPA